MNKVIKTRTYPNDIIFSLVQGDITTEEVGAIVNAANSQLLHGGGVAGAIVRKGGDIIQRESTNISPVPVGKAGITTAGSLPCKYVIHAVGPRWGEGQEHEKLKNAILASLLMASDMELNSVSMPAISTGIFGFPLNDAVDIFYKTINDFIEADPSYPHEIRICLFDQPTLDAFIEKWTQFL